MMDKGQLKVQGIRFARSLQQLVKMVSMFSSVHKSSTGLLERSYEQLNILVRQSRHLTIGFVDQRVLINNILTNEESLKPLENDLLKRGIGAVTFEAGITLAAFRNAVTVLAAQPRVIDQCGGLLPFLDQQSLEFVRIFPANKNEARNKDGDTILEMGSEEFLISKALSGSGQGFGGVDSLLNHLEPTTGSPGYFSEIQRAVEQKFEASLKNPDEDPQRGYMDLARMLNGIRPDVALGALSGVAGSGSGGSASGSSEDVTAQVFEDSALRWAMHRLTQTPNGDDGIIVEEQIFRVLMRSLQATHAASRIANRLAEFAEQYALPKHTFDRLQEEVRWMALTPRQKLRELLALNHFSAAEFRRALELIKELLKAGKAEDAAAIGLQYLTIFQDHKDIHMEESGRVPDLLRALAGVQGEFWIAAGDCLCNALCSEKVNQLVHVQVVNSIAALAKVVVLYEDFELVYKAGAALERSVGMTNFSHVNCCAPALQNLLPSSAIDRIAEIYIQKRADSTWLKTVAALLRWAGKVGIDRLFERLENEPVAANRLALIRLLSRVGFAGIEGARTRLQHQEWYVVRNACKILSELKDPELLTQLEPVLGHKDDRVQKAALQAIRESRLPGSARVLANALPALSQQLQEDVLGELMFLRDPASLPGLQAFLDCPAANSRSMLLKVIQAVSGIEGPEASALLARIAEEKRFGDDLRKNAQQVVGQRKATEAKAVASTGSNSSIRLPQLSFGHD